MNEEIEAGSSAEMEPQGDATEETRPEESYWCIICGREIPLTDGVYIHDDKPRHEVLTFDEDTRPQ